MKKAPSCNFKLQAPNKGQEGNMQTGTLRSRGLKFSSLPLFRLLGAWNLKLRFGTSLALLAFIGASARAAAPPAPPAPAAPATSPTTRTAEMLPLLDGSVRYLPPAGWELLGKGDDRLR